MSNQLIQTLLLGLLTGRGRDLSLPAGPESRRKQSRKVGRTQSSSGPTGMSPMNSADLVVKPPSMLNVPNSVPRNLQNQVVFDIVKVTSVVNLSTSAISENNYVFSLTSHPQSSNWAVLFDQWTIPQASVTFTSEMPPGNTGTPAVLTTALDFDNNTSLGSVAQLQDFSSARVLVLEPGASVTRSIRPAIKPTLNGVSNSGVARSWVDSAQPAINFLCIRSIATTAQTVYSVNVTVTIWYAFRNSI